MIEFLLWTLGYAAGGSVAKWILDYRLPSDSWRYDSAGESMWSRAPPLYVFFVTLWPLSLTITALVGTCVTGYQLVQRCPTLHVTQIYEDTYKRLTGKE